jgi:DtxR family manganese transport transcriptional regulator
MPRKPPQPPALPPAADPAARHQRTRQAHALETAEDYAEAISDLARQNGQARVTDLARTLGVSHVAVVRTLARLRRDGVVVPKPCPEIALTPAGTALAVQSRRRHKTVLAFLLALGVSEPIAQTDAEGIEHHVSEETLEAFARVARGRT